MTVARLLRKFQQEYAWSYKLCNWAYGSIGYSPEKDSDSRRHAYKIISRYAEELSIIQIKHLYKKIKSWLDEIIEKYA